MLRIDWITETTLTELTLLGLAFLLSAVIGVERTRRLKSAGIRTHTLVGVGTAVFTLVSAYGFQGVTGPDSIVDPSRIAAQIVSGIGFLGAGVIFVRRASVSGLTTAASIWVTASIGMACGAGSPMLALAATVLYLVAVVGLGRFVSRIQRDPGTHSVRLKYREGHGALRTSLALSAQYGFEATVTEAAARGKPGKLPKIAATIELRGHPAQSATPLLEALADVRGVRAVSLVGADEA